MSVEPIVIKDNDYQGISLSEEQAKPLRRYAGIGLDKLCAANPGLLLFPQSFGENGDKIKDPLYSFVGDKFCSGNVVGFWGVDGVDVRVHSRFDADRRQYLFHYMLQRIAGVNVMNLATLPDDEQIWNFLIYMFPTALKRAVRHGIYRTYRAFQYDDDRVRGAVNVPQFIRRDIPFRGNVSYSPREHSANNPVLQLIRHAIEYIRRKAPALLRIDGEMANAVATVVQLTPDYSERNRARVVSANLRPVRHPFYSDYTGLQKLCLQILRHERLSFGSGDGEISGIVFDAAWLWEEYLNSVFAASDGWHDMVHPRNHEGGKGIWFYKPDTENDSYRVRHYPDFYDPTGKIVLDAKYKRDNGIGADDLAQIVSYMHILGYRTGVFLKPDPEIDDSCYRKDGTLNTGANPPETVGVVKFKIPKAAAAESFADFAKAIGEQESKFLDACTDACGPLGIARPRARK